MGKSPASPAKAPLMHQVDPDALARLLREAAEVRALLSRLERLVIDGREAAERAAALELSDAAQRRMLGAAWPSRLVPRRGEGQPAGQAGSSQPLGCPPP
jgi:hypothetical protein